MVFVQTFLTPGVNTLNNSIVRYANGLNAVPLRSFSSVDMDLFWAICSKMKRKGVHEELLSFEEIKFMISYDPSKGLDRFYTELIKMSNKLSTMYFIYQTENIYDRLNLFQRFKIDKDNQTVLVKVSDEFEWILNNIGKNFTRFELETMTQLSSTYTKELYRQLMAHRDRKTSSGAWFVKIDDEFEWILNNIGKNFTRFELETMTQLSSTYTKELYRQLMAHRDRKTSSGAWFVKIDDFRKILSIPDSYRMSDIDRQILKTAKKEFTIVRENGYPLFDQFKVEKIKARKGNKISSLKIYFKEHRMHVSLHNWLES